MMTCGAIFSDMSNVREIRPSNSDFPKSVDLRENIYPVINQGSRGICTSVSMTDTIHYLEKFQKKDYKLKRDFFYNNRKDKKIDGMTVREAMERAKSMGIVKSYGKLQSVEAVKFALFTLGPVIICTNAYSNGSDLYWRKGGSLMGGHATVLVGYNKEGFILKNSWGTQFGDRGYVVFPYDDFKYIRELWTVVY